jgi:hypothetical protein
VTTGIVVLVGASALPAAAGSNEPSMTIRVYDYQHLAPESIARAQRRVTDIYGTIGVRAEWREVMRPSAAQPFDPSTIPDAEDLLVIVLREDMSRHKMFDDHVLGTAVVTPHDGGRIAYVLFDRLEDMARAASADPMDVMGVVIAHELGHLMLPGQGHALVGLMRATWSPRELRNGFQEQTAFTAAQGTVIRNRLLQLASAPASTAPAARTGD